MAPFVSRGKPDGEARFKHISFTALAIFTLRFFFHNLGELVCCSRHTAAATDVMLQADYTATFCFRPSPMPVLGAAKLSTSLVPAFKHEGAWSAVDLPDVGEGYMQGTIESLKSEDDKEALMPSFSTWLA